MAGFVAGVDRGQATLLPECLDGWVDESNPIRVIDAFVDALGPSCMLVSSVRRECQHASPSVSGQFGSGFGAFRPLLSASSARGSRNLTHCGNRLDRIAAVQRTSILVRCEASDGTGGGRTKSTYSAGYGFIFVAEVTMIVIIPTTNRRPIISWATGRMASC